MIFSYFFWQDCMYYHDFFDTLFRKSRVIVATASPEKFPDAVAKAVGKEHNSSEIKPRDLVNKIAGLFDLPTKYNDQMKVGEDWTAILRAKVEEISNNLSNE